LKNYLRILGNNLYWYQHSWNGEPGYNFNNNLPLALASNDEGTNLIPEIKGLKFLPGKEGDKYEPSRIVIDKANKRMRFGAGCQIVIPNTTKGEIIYIEGFGHASVTGADFVSGALGTNEVKGIVYYKSNADGNVTINISDNYCYLYRIGVGTPPGIQMVIPYPANNVSVAARVVINSNDDTKRLSTEDNDKPISAILTGGESTVECTIASDGSYHGWAFKPTNALQPNTTYTLTIPGNTLKTTNGIVITDQKTFTFTTVSSISGTAPKLKKTNGNSSPYENQVITDYKNGNVTLKFDQNITVMDGAKIDITPYGGSEYNSRGEYYTGIGSTYNNQITVSGNQLSFKFSNTDMHYDLYYKVILPANTVIGVGGTPNAADEYIFKVGPAEGYSSGYNFSSNEGYPYTWDLMDMNSDDVTAIKASKQWASVDDGYARKNMTSCFGKELEINDGVKMKDLKGLRIASKRDNTSNVIRILDIDNVHNNRHLRLHGNTQYMTIPNVPASTDNVNGNHYLYIRAEVSQHGVLNLNCPPSVAEWVGDSPNYGDGKKVYKVNVKQAGDIPFVCSDVNFYQIAVSRYNKTLTSGGEGYATDTHNYSTIEIPEKGVDYAMTEMLTDQSVTPYYVTSVSGGNDKTPGTVTLTQVSGGVYPGQGTVLKGTAGEVFPVFVKAFSKQNSSYQSNMLTGVVYLEGSSSITLITLNQQESNKYYYVLNNQYINVKDDDNETQTGSGTGIGFYLVHKATPITMQDHSAYLEWNSKLNQGGNLSGVSTAREVYFFKFEDENGNELTSISPIEADGIKDSYTNGNGLYYDLRGQRHVYPTKSGLYLHNGKKIYIK
jgi:hypothetical protein